MIGSSHAQLCKKNSCSIKLQGGPLDHTLGRTHSWPYPLEDTWVLILQNNSKCVLLNDNQMPHEILFSLLDKIQNNKNEHTRIERKEIETKVREIGRVVLIFI